MWRVYPRRKLTVLIKTPTSADIVCCRVSGKILKRVLREEVKREGPKL